MFKKLFKDLWATLYDDQEYEVISLPRVVFALSVLMVLVAWVADQFFGFEYKNMTQLVGFRRLVLQPMQPRNLLISEVMNN